MFTNERINHSKYGMGTIVDVDINTENELNSLATIKFDSGEEKKIALFVFGSGVWGIKGYSHSESGRIEKFNQEIKDKQNKDKEERISNEIRERKIKKIQIPFHEYDDTEREVTIEDWKKAWEKAGEYRFPNERRAVVMDGKKVFINASAGCRYIETNVKLCNNVYDCCEGKKKTFMSHKWKYATKDNIQFIIDELEKENNDTK